MSNNSYNTINEHDTPRDVITKVIANMALNENFWGYLFGRIQKVENSNIPSIMGVGPTSRGGIALYYHPDLIKKTKINTMMWVFQHEGYHLLNNHITRSSKIVSTEIDKKEEMKKRYLLNIASDCSVNEQIGFPESVEIDGEEWPAQFPKNYNLQGGSAFEAYYYALLEQSKSKCPVCSSSSSGGDSEDSDSKGQGDSGSESSEQNSDPNSEDGNGGNGGDIKVSQNCPCCGKELNSKTIDSHDLWEQCNSEDDARKIEDQLRKIVRDSVKSYKQSRGTLPDDLKELIDSLLEPPKIPYYQIIRSLVQASRLGKYKTGYSRINKKRVYTFFQNGNYTIPKITPFPGKVRDFTFKIVILIDTSGSQSPVDIAEALSGCKDIIEKDRYCSVTVIENDAQIGKEYEVKKVDDIDFEISGRGGTVLQPGIVRAKQLQPDVMIGFTDGYCDNVNEFPSEILPKKIIWVISEGGSSDNLDRTGHVVFIDKND